MFAITPKRVGEPVGARPIEPGWDMTSGETFTVDAYNPDMVLAEDEVSLRQPTADETLSSVKKSAHAAIDREAGAARQRFATDGWGIESEYRIAEEQARAFAANGYQGAVPAAVQAEMDASGSTAQAATDLILGMADQLIGVIEAIRRARLLGKAAVDSATTLADVEAAEAAALDSLRAMRP